MDSFDIVMEPLFTEEIMSYLNSRKLKPSPINPYNRTKDPVDHIWTFQSLIYYMGAYNAIMCRAFQTTFYLVARD